MISKKSMDDASVGSLSEEKDNSDNDHYSNSATIIKRKKKMLQMTPMPVSRTLGVSKK